MLNYGLLAGFPPLLLYFKLKNKNIKKTLPTTYMTWVGHDPFHLG